MSKEIWKPGNMLYPLPVVMVSMRDKKGSPNIITVAWTGTVSTNPAMVYISVRPERYSYSIIKEAGEFAINLTTRELARATDFCGVKSGGSVDKFEALGLHACNGIHVKAPLIEESPINIECRTKQIIPCGSHDMFLAEVLAVHADNKYMDSKGKFDLSKAEPIVYSHGDYYTLGTKLGKFGYSVKKK
ncbi:flavin reductase family protein [Parasporobacterium paucivorans]|uniref:NADH-FMN oxidoreductase RutF, flavin reductase (DIM6/NTAB) family n=1 Tax=Parasporobacterium paucivorans DSM 15970 TaxID=1122934 RepID=A0A1M6BEF1_9FIRM|nr:flavin reductase family protein [Parasporobacterium paucivorans]SHI46823.1 NADH-FMN oxidoreductase RutF, flavin reductase (DIM6/NTAB) family [Parasporobacterium paucivorans DSM 15970]